MEYVRNIRSYLRSALLGAACAVAIIGITAVPLLTMTGCTQAQRDTIATLTGTLTRAVASVATLEGNPALAASLTLDGQAVQNALANWHQGGVVDGVIQALGILQDDLNLIPGSSQYAPLVDIAIATAQTLLALIPPSAVSAPVKLSMKAHRSRAVFLGHPAPKNDVDFVKQWNAVARANPQLAAAAIK